MFTVSSRGTLDTVPVKPSPALAFLTHYLLRRAPSRRTSHKGALGKGTSRTMVTPMCLRDAHASAEGYMRHSPHAAAGFARRMKLPCLGLLLDCTITGLLSLSSCLCGGVMSGEVRWR